MSTATRFDPAALFDALARHAVEYVTVGGVAVQAHGGQRLTQDLDILTLPAHLGEFGDLRQRAHDVPLGDVTVPIARREDLIRMKRAAGRPQDVADVLLLESLDDRP